MSNIYNLLPLQRRIDKLSEEVADLAGKERELQSEVQALELTLGVVKRRRKSSLELRNQLAAALRVLKEEEA